MKPGAPTPLDLQRRVVSAPTEAARLLSMARHALRSYQYGNAAPDLAADCASQLEAFLGLDPMAPGPLFPPR